MVPSASPSMVQQVTELFLFTFAGLQQTDKLLAGPYDM